MKNKKTHEHRRAELVILVAVIAVLSLVIMMVAIN
jgi:hypothetical protein